MRIRRRDSAPPVPSEGLVRYWGTGYDWRKAEAKLNSFPQFMTGIDGVDVHFIHVRSRHPNALPLIITHGWPGSVFEQIKLIGPLTDPTAFGGRAGRPLRHVGAPGAVRGRAACGVQIPALMNEERGSL